MKTMNLKRVLKNKALEGDFDASPKMRPRKSPKQIASQRGSETLWPTWTGSFALKFLVLFFGMALWGCQKDQVQTTVIEGRITELGSFEPIRVAGLRLGLYVQDGFSFFPKPATKIAEFTTNQDGEFYHELNLEKHPSSYFIEFIDAPEGYFTLGNVHYLNSSLFNFVQLNLNKEAWLKVTLNNEGGGQFDYFIFAVNGVRYTHTGGGSPFIIQRVASYDSNLVVVADHRTIPESYLRFSTLVLPRDTLDFEIDLRSQ